MTKLTRLACLALASFVASACVDMELTEEELGAEQAAINGGSLALEWMYRRAVEPEYPCSATLIGPRHVLTALHCTKFNKEGTQVRFYTSATTLTSARVLAGTRTVTFVHRPLGTNAFATPHPDKIDMWGDFADIAVLDLDGDAPATSTVTAMKWTYPGDGASVVSVGSGKHDGVANDDSELQYVTGVLASPSDSGGNISTEEADTAVGDSGGSVYHAQKLVGVVSTSYGSTSVPHHLPWILDMMEWTWPYGSIQSGVQRVGATLSTFSGSELVCQYACAVQAECSAYCYSQASSGCMLLTGGTSAFASPGHRSDAKY